MVAGGGGRRQGAARLPGCGRERRDQGERQSRSRPARLGRARLGGRRSGLAGGRNFQLAGAREVGAQRLPRHFLKLAQAGQLAQIFQAKVHQKIARRPVKDGPPHYVLAARGDHQFSFQQRVDDSAAIHAANIVDFGRGHRLAVSNDGQGLESGLRQADGRLQALDELAQHVVVFGFGGEFVAARDLPDLNAVLRLLEIFHQFAQLFFDPVALLALERLDDGFERHWLGRDVNDGLDQSFQVFVGQHINLSKTLFEALLDFGDAGHRNDLLEALVLMHGDGRKEFLLPHQHGTQADHFEQGQHQRHQGLAR